MQDTDVKMLEGQGGTVGRHSSLEGFRRTSWRRLQLRELEVPEEQQHSQAGEDRSWEAAGGPVMTASCPGQTGSADRDRGYPTRVKLPPCYVMQFHLFINLHTQEIASTCQALHHAKKKK